MHSLRWCPLRKMSSQGMRIIPFDGSPSKNLYLWKSSCTSLPGYEDAGASVNLQLSSKAIPASVVFEMMNLISGCSARAMKAWFCEYGLRARLITSMRSSVFTGCPFSFP